MEAKWFKLYELVDKDTYFKYQQDSWNLFPAVALSMVDGLREYFDAPVTVNSWWWGGQLQYRGYRPPWCMVGAPLSYHKRGEAFDCDIKGLNAEDARKKILDFQHEPLLKKIGRMELGVNWLHIDTGPRLRENGEGIYVFYP